MATFQNVGTIGESEEKFITGMLSRGYDPEFTAACWKQIKGFGSYGFPESHAASFANLVYASAWIKCRYPDVFAAALLNSQPMGFYAPAQIVRDAQEHGVDVRPVDVNLSDWDCNLEKGRRTASGQLALLVMPACETQRHPYARLGTHALRLGFRQISGFSEHDGKIIESVRGAGFDSVRDLWLRTRLNPAALEKLAEADAFRSLGLDRREALWAVRALQRAGDKDNLPLFARVAMPELEPDVDLPPMLPGQHVVEDYRHLHLSLKAHPVSFLRADLHVARHHSPMTALVIFASGRRVTVAGLVLVRQRPGQGNVIFMTLEDETAIANTIIWPRVFETFRPVVLGSRLISVTGKLQNDSGVIHVVAEHMEDLSPLLPRLSEDTAPPTPPRAPTSSNIRWAQGPPAPASPCRRRPGDCTEEKAGAAGHIRRRRPSRSRDAERPEFPLKLMPGRHRGEPGGIIGQPVAAPGDMQVRPQQQEVVAVDRARPGIGDVEDA